MHSWNWIRVTEDWDVKQFKTCKEVATALRFTFIALPLCIRLLQSCTLAKYYYTAQIRLVNKSAYRKRKQACETNFEKKSRMMYVIRPYISTSHGFRKSPRWRNSIETKICKPSNSEKLHIWASHASFEWWKKSQVVKNLVVEESQDCEMYETRIASTAHLFSLASDRDQYA